jgi:hypothetical protein
MVATRFESWGRGAASDRLIATVALASVLYVPAVLAGEAAEDLRCERQNAVVRAADARDARTACEAVADAAGFLGRQGLDISEPIEVQVVDKLPAAARPEAQGCYVHRERRVYVRALRVFRKQDSFLGLPIDRTVYRSLIAHEVGHAIGACNFSVPAPTLPAQEYIAYVTMFATMPEPLRRRVLQRLPGEGFKTEAEINVTVYAMNPDLFGAQAYRHFVRPENGPAFLRQVLSGRALAAGDAI